MIYKKSWKYILIRDSIYYHPKALKDFGDIHKGNLGGFIKGYHNLSQKGNCWVYDKAIVRDNAKITENARVCDKARVCGFAQVFGNALVSGYAEICGDSRIYGNAHMKNLKLTKGVINK